MEKLSEKFLNKIAEYSKNTVEDIKSMPFSRVALDVILPEIANIYCISDNFLFLMADFTKEMKNLDDNVTSNFLEIALQRISRGAVLHEGKIDPEKIDEGICRAYSSAYNKSIGLTRGCYSFLINTIETCLTDKRTKEHAVKILFALVKEIDPDKGTWGTLNVVDNSIKKEDNARKLYALATELLETFVDFDTLFENYVCPDQWEKHILWLHKNIAKIDWKRLYKKLGVSKRKEKKEIKGKIADIQKAF